MKAPTGSLHLNIVAAFLALVILSGSSLTWLLNRELKQRLPLISQLTYRDLAANLAPELQPLVEHHFDEESLLRKIYQLHTELPGTQAMLIDSEGKTPERIAHGRVWPEDIEVLDMEPVRNFSALSKQLTTPLTLRAKWIRTPCIFSAAPIIIEDRPGFLIVILDQDSFDCTVAMLFDFELFKYAAFVLCLAALAAIPLGTYIFFLITRPFRAMTAAINHFAAGDYSVRLSAPDRNEIYLYARAFNKMADTVSSEMSTMKRDDMLRRQFIRGTALTLTQPLKRILDHSGTISFAVPASERKLRYDELRLRCDELRSTIDDLFARAFREMNKLADGTDDR